MRDGMHQIDLGAIIRLILAMVYNFFHCVDDILDVAGLAAANRLGERMRKSLCLAHRSGPDGQMWVNVQYMQICNICLFDIL